MQFALRSTFRLTVGKQTVFQAKILILFYILFPSSRILSEEVPLNIAIERAVQSAQVDRLDEAAMDEARSYRDSAARLPNPSFIYEQERLGGSRITNDSRETRVGLAAPLDFIWKRSSRIEAAALRGQISQHDIEDQRRQIARGIALLFSEYAANRLTLERHEAAHVALNRARVVALARVDAGDAPPTLINRVEVAISRHVLEENRIETELLSIRSRFGALLGEKDVEPLSHEISIDAPLFATADEARDVAFSIRPDLKAAEALFEWKKAEQKVAHRTGLPELALEAAHIDDNIGRDGFLLGLSVELPLFDRNQDNKLLANSERIRAQVAFHRAQRIVEEEVMTAYNRWKQLSESRQLSEVAHQASRNASLLLKAIEASFEAGEASLLDYLDVIDAYLSISEEEVQLEHSLRLAAIDLAYTTGTPLVHD